MFHSQLSEKEVGTNFTIPILNYTVLFKYEWGKDLPRSLRKTKDGDWSNEHEVSVKSVQGWQDRPNSGSRPQDSTILPIHILTYRHSSLYLVSYQSTGQGVDLSVFSMCSVTDRFQSGTILRHRSRNKN